MNVIRKFLCLIILSFTFNNTYALSLTIGTISYNPPFASLSEKNEFYGFEIELMKEICKRLNAKCIFKEVKFFQIPEMLQTNQIDVAVAAIVITPDRQQKFLFSLPYKKSYLQYVALANSNAKTFQDLTNTTLGIYSGSPAEELAAKHFNKNIQLKYFDDCMEMLAALENNSVDAVLTGYPQAVYWVSNDTAIKLVDKQFDIGSGYGIMTKLGNDDLMKQINKAILDIEADGTYVNLYEGSF